MVARLLSSAPACIGFTMTWTRWYGGVRHQPGVQCGTESGETIVSQETERNKLPKVVGPERHRPKKTSFDRIGIPIFGMTLGLIGMTTILGISFGVMDYSKNARQISRASANISSRVTKNWSPSTQGNAISISNQHARGGKEGLRGRRANKRVSTNPAIVENESDNQVDTSPTESITSEFDSQDLEDESQSLSNAQRLARKRWRKVQPALLQHRVRVTEIASQAIDEVWGLAFNLKSQAGVDSFIEDALTLESKAWALSNPTEHREWIESQFLEKVVDLDAFREQLNAIADSLQHELTELDDELLIELRLDSDFDASELRIDAIEFDRLNDELSVVLPHVCDSVYDAMAKSLVSLAAGLGTGIVAEDMARSAFADENGNVDLLSGLASMAIGFLADEVASTIADEVMQTDEVLEAALDKQADRLSIVLRYPGPAHSAWLDEFNSLAHSHDSQVVDLVIQHIGVDREWALNTLEIVADE